MNKKTYFLILYCIFFILGLSIILRSGSIAEIQSRVYSDDFLLYSVNPDDVTKKMVPMIVTGGIIAFIAGNGIVLTLNKKD